MNEHEFLNQDRFFLDLDNGVVEWMYYNPDSVSGGQFVVNLFSVDDITDALAETMDVENAFDYIGSACKQYLVDMGTAYFGEAWKQMSSREPFQIGCSYTTLDNLRLAFQARDLLNQYCQHEFEMDAEYGDLRKIAIGYTTITDAEHHVQGYANLIDHRIEVYLNGSLAMYDQFESLKEMVEHGLPGLEFEDIYSVPDWVVADHERVAREDSLATRLVLFMKQYDPMYPEIMEPGETDVDMIRKMKTEFTDLDLIPPTIEEIEAVIKGRDLPAAEREKLYDIMTDLYHMYTEQMYVPVFDRESEILSSALNAVGIMDGEINFDGEGISFTRGGKKWYNGDIYRHLGNSIPRDVWRQFRYNCFPDYTDFADAAAHYGVQIGWHLKPAPVARIDFLSPSGTVVESMNFLTEAEFIKELKENLDYGVPLTVVLYRGVNGKTISRDFLNDLDTLPKGVKVENAIVLSPEERGAAR